MTNRQGVDFHLATELRRHPHAVTDETRELALAGLIRRDARDLAPMLGLIPDTDTPPPVVDPAGCAECGDPCGSGRNARVKDRCRRCYARLYRQQRRQRAGGAS